MNYCIAIDGPSGAGKSTLSRRLAAHYGWLYVDTGAIYRAVGLACERMDVNPRDETAVAGRVLPNIKIELEYGADGGQITVLNGENVASEIRRDTISKYASDVSALAGVRSFLLQMQRDTASARSVIMDGRDVGTVVIPDATVKIFLTATPEVRAQRRYYELLQRGETKEFKDVLQSILERDANDSGRANAPLKQAADAIVLDSTDLNEDETFERAVIIIDSIINRHVNMEDKLI